MHLDRDRQNTTILLKKSLLLIIQKLKEKEVTKNKKIETQDKSTINNKITKKNSFNRTQKINFFLFFGEKSCKKAENFQCK